ncbi:hypothetical protein AJ80_00153 [Polytolypa hystricis UAMH7299]|uniref:polynucleotide adenylyltransferase n=1 Tax=Polytolypa hystricis (strain UAMH7299) TaxID=1447883 RepID=A0A2B7Z5E8_POLH7|nr:hypothetical protein AJ80_00153 [Polytolypa hystricis UAMH7299]
MAGATESSHPQGPLSLDSYQTALCIIPPQDLHSSINRLRELHDQAFEKWPAHVNLLYPFVAPEKVPRAVELIGSKLADRFSKAAEDGSQDATFTFRLDGSDYFEQRHRSIIHLAPGNDDNDDDDNGAEALDQLRSAIMEGFKQSVGILEYNPHLTIGQTKPKDDSLRDYLLAKAQLLTPIEWRVGELVVLVRQEDHRMKIWGTVPLSGRNAFTLKRSLEEDESEDEKSLPLRTSTHDGTPTMATLQPRTTYQFSTSSGIWEPVEKQEVLNPEEAGAKTPIKVSSYNILVDSNGPPTEERSALIVQEILSKSALADVLVLQEVSDDVLCYILQQESVQSQYPFVTHGPPSQPEIGPLPSLRNIVVLSWRAFQWGWLPFENKHKGAAILTMDAVGKYANDASFLPLVISGVHLSSGLTDSTIAAKKAQLRSLLDYFSTHHAANPQIIAGDFNLATSTFSIEEAQTQKCITSQTKATMSFLETMISEAGFSDSWLVARTEKGVSERPASGKLTFEDLYDGEEGSTFDPVENPLAALSAGRNGNTRPQRYDRVLFKEDSTLTVKGFNLFGFPRAASGEEGLLCPSDHWGVRASFLLAPTVEAGEQEGSTRHIPLDIIKSTAVLSDPLAVEACLLDNSIVPSAEEAEKRRDAFNTLKTILLHESQEQTDTYGNARSAVSLVITTVGSYGLGVWTAASDIDCLCIGSISSRTFFELAGQRLRKAADAGVRIIRKVKAASGTMLEVEVKNVRVDLQYCPAARIVERWSDVALLPPSDPLFDLSLLSLTKLQPYRDLAYLQRTIPHPATFRRLHRLIKAWAKQRGIYSSKFGYLGGIHITLLLSRLFKLLPYSTSISPADILCTFFNHYANFDWKSDMVYDPFFHKQKLRFRRWPREGMVILTHHVPLINVARTSSVPSVRTITDELKLTSARLSQGLSLTEFAGIRTQAGNEGLPSGAREFLEAYNSYIKINVQYWGLSLSKGSTLVGWLESRCIFLLVDLDRKLPNIHTRIWPARFTLASATSSNNNSPDDKEYQGCYLIGLKLSPSSTDDPSAPSLLPSKSDRKHVQDALQASLDRFSEQIHKNTEYFDAASAWVDVSQIKVADLGELKLDEREWGDYVVPADDEYSDSDAADGDDEHDFDIDDEDEAAISEALEVKRSKKNKLITTNTNTNSAPVSARKLRPASDILNRLRWDPHLDSADYIVGYEDRFLGTRELALDRWKTEQTDEEFIPLHRVAYFKRKVDGVVVWDRSQRRDEIFGSGVSGGREGEEEEKEG